MHPAIILGAVLLIWSQSAVAQQPFVDCVNSWECCVQKFRDPTACGPGSRSTTRQSVERALNTANHAESATQSTAIDGKSVNSQLNVIAEHLALILELDQIGGIKRPDKSPRKETRNHWWSEVKTAMQNIRQELRRCRSRKQLLSALGKRRDALTPAQIADIEARLTEAALLMGEEVGELLPCK
jgi:hypothetical protein